jgi:hypothetical protein
MQTKFEIIETENYILAVSDEKIKENSYAIALDTNTIFKVKVDIRGINKFPHLYRKIIAYQSKGNAPELDLPLLPEMVVEDEVEKLIDDFIYEYQQEGMLPSIAKDRIYQIIKAATKKYSEEDLLNAFYNGWIYRGENYQYPKAKEEFLKNIKQHQTHKWFVPQIIVMNKGYTDINDYPYQECEVLKTTTINGKTYLVGTYLYE